LPNQFQVIALHDAHPEWSAGRIAKALKCDAGYVRATGQRKGLTLPTTRNPGRRLQDRERKAIEDAYGAGEKLEAVAVEFGVTHWAVSKIGRRAGYPPRRAGRRSRGKVQG